jgi:hypothetical protein
MKRWMNQITPLDRNRAIKLKKLNGIKWAEKPGHQVGDETEENQRIDWVESPMTPMRSVWDWKRKTLAGRFTRKHPSRNTPLH